VDVLHPFRMAFHGVPRQSITIRMDVWMLELAREVARRYSLDYQRVLRMYVEQGLRRAMEEGAKGAT